MASAASVSSTAACRRPASDVAFENVGAHWSPALKPFGNRRVHAVQRQARLGQPVGERVDGCRVAVVEMAAGGEELDRSNP